MLWQIIRSYLLNEALENKIDRMELSMQYQSDIVELEIPQEKTALRQRCLVNEGRLTRMDKIVDNQHEETLQINARSMNDNIVSQNINEITGDENDTKTVVNFM